MVKVRVGVIVNVIIMNIVTFIFIIRVSSIFMIMIIFKVMVYCYS